MYIEIRHAKKDNGRLWNSRYMSQQKTRKNMNVDTPTFA